jgi:hypothetical protein
MEILQLPLPRWLTLHNWTLKCTALTRWTELGRSSHVDRTHRERRLQHLFYCCLTSPRTRILRALHSKGRCLQSPLSNGSIRNNIKRNLIRGKNEPKYYTIKSTFVYGSWTSGNYYVRLQCSASLARPCTDGYGVNGGGIRVRFPAGLRVSLLHSVQIDTGAHPASYPKRTGSFPRG